jgi:hypothetical protein
MRPSRRFSNDSKPEAPQMKMGRDRHTRVRELRDAAVALAQQFGAWEACGQYKALTARVGSLTIAYRTPFQRMPGPSDEIKYFASLASLPGPLSLPYGIDAWAPKKVLNIEWNESGDEHVSGFRSGPWEADLLGQALPGQTT